MKKLAFALAVVIAVVLPAAAQNQTRQRLSTEPNAQSPSASATRTRVTTQPANHVKKEPDVVPSANLQSSKPTWGDTAVPANVSAAPQRTYGPAPLTAKPKNTTPTPALVKRTALNVESSAAPVNLRAAAATTEIYRVGVGDVLDIRLANLATRDSTLFTVMKNGTLEHPLIGNPVRVAGMTPDEIARRLTTEIKVIQNPRPIVSVRDYASHGVLITGAVDNPGRKMLRREAMPLFTLLAEALSRSDAATAVVLRNGKEMVLSLAKSQDLATLIVAGDTIRVLSTAKQFVYVGGDIASAGEKELRDGMTLTQALLAAGGVRRDSQSKARVTRRDSSGFLKSEEYNLNAIEAGKAPDPLLQPGDRIEVKRSM